MSFVHSEIHTHLLSLLPSSREQALAQPLHGMLPPRCGWLGAQTSSPSPLVTELSLSRTPVFWRKERKHLTEPGFSKASSHGSTFAFSPFTGCLSSRLPPGEPLSGRKLDRMWCPVELLQHSVSAAMSKPSDIQLVKCLFRIKQ